jgi:hypothetical protein
MGTSYSAGQAVYSADTPVTSGQNEAGASYSAGQATYSAESAQDAGGAVDSVRYSAGNLGYSADTVHYISCIDKYSAEASIVQRTQPHQRVNDENPRVYCEVEAAYSADSPLIRTENQAGASYSAGQAPYSAGTTHESEDAVVYDMPLSVPLHRLQAHDHAVVSVAFNQGWIYVCMYVFMYVCMYVCMYIYMYVCIYVQQTAGT